MNKIEEKKRSHAFVHNMGEAFVRHQAKTVEYRGGGYSNLVYLDIMDKSNDITLLFESVDDIDNLIESLKYVKTSLRCDNIELGRVKQA